MAYVETPHTDIGNATYLSNGNNIDNLSVEPSFLSPVKGRTDLVQRPRNVHGISQITPMSRAPFADRRNHPIVLAPQEFTPLLKSAAKKNLLRRGKESGLPFTPAFLKQGYRVNDSPALPAAESSVVYGDDTGSSNGGQDEVTPAPQIASSSTHSTPLAVMPKRNNEGVLAEQGNVLALREQENIIDKIEKENFGLKLKIHFLEESLRKSGPELHQTAVKENTELKVDKVTMQKELSRTRKTLNQAERELGQYKQELTDALEDATRKHADQAIQEELQKLRGGLEAKEGEVQDLHIQLYISQKKNKDVETIKNTLEELEAEVREKDRIVDERDEELDKLKERGNDDENEILKLEEELESVKLENDELRGVQKTMEGFKTDMQRAKDGLEEAKNETFKALEERKSAEDDLHELREDIANKSFSTKGLSRQLEEKANKLQNDLSDLRKTHADLQERYDDTERKCSRFEENIQSIRRDTEVQEQKLRDDNELLRNECETASQKRDSYKSQIQSTVRDLQSRSEEKDMLQSRHDALTAESRGLQKDLLKARAKMEQLQQSLEDEKQHALKNNHAVQSQAKQEVDQLIKRIDDLNRELDNAQSHHIESQDRWDSQKRDLQMQKLKAEERASGLKRTVDRLQEIEGSLSGKELKLKDALESEKRRYADEEVVLNRQIGELQEELDNKRQSEFDQRNEILSIKEKLCTYERDRFTSEERIQSLEDEIEVLQTTLDEEADRASSGIDKATQGLNDLRQQLRDTEQELASKQEAHVNAQAEIEVCRFNLEAGKEAQQQLQQVREENLVLDSDMTTMRCELHGLRASAKSRECELAASKLKVQQLESRLHELETVAHRARSSHKGTGIDLSLIQHDLSTAREMEIEYLRREGAHKDTIRELKHRTSIMERKLHEAELSRMQVKSPESSVDNSARQTEIVELRSQLTEAHQQVKDARAKSKESEREAQHKIIVLNKEHLIQSEALEHQRDQVELELSECRLQREDYVAKDTTTEKTIGRLRTRIRTLEKDLHAARLNQNEDRTIAEERKDLHEMLKDAKLEAEDLHVQIGKRDERIQSVLTQENELRIQLKRVREERNVHGRKGNALSKELENLQLRYEECVENLARQHQVWEEERKGILSRVRFPNTSISSVHVAGGDSAELKALELEAEKKEKRHQAELRGLAKQIHWLRARCVREEDFRAGLAFEKKYLMLQIDMYNACNRADLEILEEMGIKPVLKVKGKKRSLRAVGLMIVATVKMKKLQEDWAAQKKIKASLVKKVEQMRRTSRRSGGR